MASNENNIYNSSVGVILYGSPKNVNIGQVNVTSEQSSTSSSSQVADFDLPEPIVNFTGRDKELKHLETLFFNEDKTKLQNKVVICGIAGIGKSELAVQFADKCQKAGTIKNVYRINSEHENELRKSWLPIKEIYKKRGKSLFILDNGVSRKKLRESGFKMPDDFFFIITSQIKDWGDDIIVIELSTLDIGSALEFYQKKLKDVYKEKDRALLKELANLVGCIPLGLQITAAGVREYKKMFGEYCVHEYLEELKNSENKIIDEEFPSSSDNPYDKTLNEAIKMSLKKLESETGPLKSNITLDVLYMCSCIHPGKIHLYEAIDSLLINNEKYVNYNKNMLRKALYTLDNLSLLTFRDDYVNMHRFTQKMLSYNLKTDRQTSFYEMCLEKALVSDCYSVLCFDVIPEILQYSDATIKRTIMNFLVKYNSMILVPAVRDVFSIIFSNLMFRGYNEFIKEIFETPGHYAEDYIIECRLLSKVKDYKYSCTEEFLQGYLGNKSKNINHVWKTIKALEFYKYKLKDVYKDKDRDLLAEVANLIGCIQPGLHITAGGVLQYYQTKGANCVQEYLVDLKQSQNYFISSFDSPYDNTLYGAIKILLNQIEVMAGLLNSSFIFDVLYISSCTSLYISSIFMYESYKMILQNSNKYGKNENKLTEALEIFAYFLPIMDKGKRKLHDSTRKLMRYYFTTEFRTNRPDDEKKIYETCLENSILSNVNSRFDIHILRSISEHIDVTIEPFIMSFLEKYKTDIQNNSTFKVFKVVLCSLVRQGQKEFIKKIFGTPGHSGEDYVKEFKLLEEAKSFKRPDMEEFLQNYLDCKNKDSKNTVNNTKKIKLN